jgi:hypothetical protein
MILRQKMFKVIEIVKFLVESSQLMEGILISNQINTAYSWTIKAKLQALSKEMITTLQ